MNILLSSVGRRPYLVRWFQEALAANDIKGRVIAADLDPVAPVRAFADAFVLAPSADDPCYREWLANLLNDWAIDLAISINDFELSEWAALPRSTEWAPLVRLSAAAQHLVEDKSAITEALAEARVVSPRTWLGSEIPSLDAISGPFVTKGRFGSGSRGLRFANKSTIRRAIKDAVGEVTTRQGVAALEQDEHEPAELVVVQERIVGVEYGLDVVCDLRGNYAAVLARRKISMRSGETDRAVSVDPSQFATIAERVAHAIPHPGTMDVDVIMDAEGTPYVIDVNPRFGGGYPFSHLAGARLPSAYVAWASGLQVSDEWLRCEVGATSGKYVEAALIDGRVDG